MIHAMHDPANGVDVSPMGTSYELYVPVSGTTFAHDNTPERDSFHLIMMRDQQLNTVYITRSAYGDFSINGLLQSCPTGE